MQVFIIHPQDNVATALTTLKQGKVNLIGTHEKVLELINEIKEGHKVALKDIDAGDPVVKFGIPIGHATRPIQKGQWVHLHNCASNFDEKSQTLDLQTGAPTESDAYQ
ncbi:hydrolase [candidate division KSB1 bacterium]|nr:hydrolase [candidate division KSB1 bacterium]